MMSKRLVPAAGLVISSAWLTIGGSITYYSRKYDKARYEASLKQEHWKEFERNDGMLKGLGFCTCDGVRSYAQIDEACRLVVEKINEGGHRRVALLDIGAGLCLPSYLLASSIVKQVPSLETLEVVLSDPQFWGQKSYLLSGNNKVEAFHRSPPLIDILASQKDELVLRTLLTSPTLMNSWLTTKLRNFLGGEGMDGYGLQLAMNLEEDLSLLKVEAPASSRQVSVHVQGDLLRTWWSSAEQVQRSLAKSLAEQNTAVVLFHSHFEAPSMLKPLARNLKLAFDDDRREFFEVNVPDPLCRYLGRI